LILIVLLSGRHSRPTRHASDIFFTSGSAGLVVQRAHRELDRHHTTTRTVSSGLSTAAFELAAAIAGNSQHTRPLCTLSHPLSTAQSPGSRCSSANAAAHPYRLRPPPSQSHWDPHPHTAAPASAPALVTQRRSSSSLTHHAACAPTSAPGHQPHRIVVRRGVHQTANHIASWRAADRHPSHRGEREITGDRLAQREIATLIRSRPHQIPTSSNLILIRSQPHAISTSSDLDLMRSQPHAISSSSDLVLIRSRRARRRPS
jgi:hypothetical protein